ncbi:unnamed protein product [Lathyrus sativus]|nr:unnamed protein product [Lathyrus sativus]
MIGSYKLTLAASEGGFVSLGCIIKDPTSNIFLAASKRFPSVTNPANAELLAIRWAFLLAKELNLKSFVFQSDAQVVVDCINDFVFIADLDSVVADCKLLMKDFDSVTLMFINRLCNLDAHHMVGIGKSFGFRT